MSRSASGTVEAPGRNVRAKAGLNKSILDQGWFEFRRQVEYKLKWLGGKLVVIPPQYTSQTCSHCPTSCPYLGKNGCKVACGNEEIECPVMTGVMKAEEAKDAKTDG